MTTRRLLAIVLPLLLVALLLQTADAGRRWRASRTTADVERATREIWAAQQRLPDAVVDQHLWLLRRAERQDPLLVDIRINRGIQYMLGGRPQGAIRAFQAALGLEERADIHASLGQAYLQADERAAAAAFGRAVALDSSLAERIDPILATLGDVTTDVKAPTPQDGIFADSFESGTATVWSSCAGCR